MARGVAPSYGLTAPTPTYFSKKWKEPLIPYRQWLPEDNPSDISLRQDPSDSVRARNHYTLVPFTEGHSSLINHPMDNLITVISRFQLPAGVAPGFRDVPDLVRKQFLRSKDCRTAGGVYLWNDERAARAFMNERVAPMIREKFRVDPVIEFFDSRVIVEN